MKPVILKPLVSSPPSPSATLPLRISDQDQDLPRISQDDDEKSACTIQAKDRRKA